MLPDGAHLREEDWTIFFLNQRSSIQKKETMNSEKNNSLLYVLNLVRTKHDKGVRRGATVKAMAICTQHQFLHIYKVSFILFWYLNLISPSCCLLWSNTLIIVPSTLSVNCMNRSMEWTRLKYQPFLQFKEEY